MSMQQRPHPQTIEINGTKLHYIERGSGVPVVFVHGGLGDFRTWLPQLVVFGQTYHALSYSRRAFFPNPYPDGYDAAMSDHISDLDALLTALDLGPAHLVANSYGGYICLNVALRYPQLVRTLALAEPPVQPLLARLPGGAEMLEEVRIRAWVPSGEAFEHGDLEEGVRLFLAGAVGPGTYEGMPQRTRDAMMKNAPEMKVATLSDYAAFMPDFTCEEARRVEAPTLLMRGTLSPRMYYLINDELARCLPHAEQALIPNAAHVLHAQNPEEHNRLVLDFIERHS
ncbi:MAG: alpha/beta hydrolase [Chloroflexota bacterium]